MAHKFKVLGLSDARLRSDGQELILEFKTAQREKLTLVVPGWAMRNVVGQLMLIDRQALIKRQIPPDDINPPILTTEPLPPMVVVAPSGLQCVVRPDVYGVDLQIQDIQGREIQVGLMSEHLDALIGAIRQAKQLDETQSHEDDDKPN